MFSNGCSHAILRMISIIYTGREEYGFGSVNYDTQIRWYELEL